jgi:Ca-activated chloride channel family protein
VKDALHYLVDQLRPTDAVAIVTFNDKAHIVREMTKASDSAHLHAAIDSLKANGSTNLGQGLSAGYQLARDSFRPNATNRVILLSDGLANTGTTDANTMLQRIRDEADKQITLLGVGVGSDYGDALMEQLADRGDGFVVYISERKQARDLFVRKLPATLAVRAYDAKAQVVFDRTTVESFHLVGYEDRALNAEDFRDDSVDGGEVGPGHSVTALYLVRLRPNADGHMADVKVRWLDPKTREASERHASVDTGDLDVAFSDASPTLQVSYVAAMFAEYLRGRKTSTLDQLIDLAQAANQSFDADPQVEELISLMRLAKRL